MANHKSAAKRARQTIVKNARNRSYLSGMRTAIKKFLVGVTELEAGKGNADDVKKLFVSAQSALQKAKSKGIIHPNNASRRVSRLSARLSKAGKA